MTLTYQDNKFVILNNAFIERSQFLAQNDLLKRTGFLWSPDLKKWWTADAVRAQKLREHADESALNQFSEAKRTVEASHSGSSDIVLECPTGLDYMPFQKAGIAYVLKQFGEGKKACLIGDEMGLGKTIQAAGIINALKPKSILIICPAILKLNWRDELKMWLVDSYKINICFGKSKVEIAEYFSKSSTDAPIGEITIINYDIISSEQYATMLKQPFDLLIADESHYLKSGKAKRTKAVGRIKADKKLWLTGTPITKFPLDLWPILKMSNHPLSHSWPYFTNQFCDPQTVYGHKQYGSSNEAELQQSLRAGFMIRRLKKDVLTELPAKTRQLITLPADTIKGALKDEKACIQRMKDKTQKVKKGGNFEEHISLLREVKSASIAEMAKVRKATAIAKIPLVISHVEDIIETGAKVVVFGWHKEVVEAVHSHFKDSVLITGDVPAGERAERIKRFQEDERVKVFIGTMGACGVGITLTAAQTVIFIELDYIPTSIMQAEDRCHRIGQQGNVLVQFLMIDGSIDARIAKGLISRMKKIDKAVNREADTLAK